MNCLLQTKMSGATTRGFLISILFFLKACVLLLSWLYMLYLYMGKIKKVGHKFFPSCHVILQEKRYFKIRYDYKNWIASNICRKLFKNLRYWFKKKKKIFYTNFSLKKKEVLERIQKQILIKFYVKITSNNVKFT